jgi:thiol-disulfide isomerase/thioredoxin
MKKTNLVNAMQGAAAALAIVALAAPGTAGTAVERDALGARRLQTLDGTPTTLSAFRGEVTVVNFWASWCAPCRQELPLLNRWNTTWAGRGARVVAVSIDRDVANARRFARDMDLTLTVLHDGPDGLARTLDIPTVPYTVLLDREGNVIRAVKGSKAEELAALERTVETMLVRRSAGAVQEAGMAAPGGER